ncbi:uncharacterized protein LOC127241170 [Andrographis paniculata]|uniref:uncharacterized protein LOC127241170 n=1 Tax=Andrographis paniculata TaxID=175694 RepID=UPI0021E7B959|nr:uncharacterized protein LOC127241170 [Andrographis paniculata]
MTSRNWSVILVFGLTLAMAVESSPESAFYGALISNALPIGLFPKGISDFSIDPASGRFLLRLLSPSSCDAKFETRVRYNCEITGNLSFGRIGNLSGVAAQELFLWLPVKGIQVDIPSSGLIYFDVGVVSKQFSLSFFETPQDCSAPEDGDVRDGDVVVLLDHNHGRLAEKPSQISVKEVAVDEGQRAVS